MADDGWQNENLQDSFDFYSVRVPGVGRRVQREDLSKLVWSVTRAAVSQPRCEAIADAVKAEPAPDASAADNSKHYLTISQCERIIREIEMQECDKFLRAAELFVKRSREAEAAEANDKGRRAKASLCFAGPPCCTHEATAPAIEAKAEPKKA